MARNLKIAAENRLVSAVRAEARESRDEDSDALRIGSILRDLGKLDDDQIELVLEQQAHSARRFGDLAVALGLVTQADITLALARLHAMDIEPARVRAAPSEGLSILEDVASPQGEMLRGIRSQLMLHWFGDEIERHTLAIVSPDHGDGRSFVCAALAILIAQLDEDTLVIDADLRRPRMHEIFGVDNSAGLSNQLLNPAERPRLQTVAGIERLHVLPAGPYRDNPHELITRKHFGLLLESMARRFSFILVDTPPASTCGEVLTIAVRSSGCLIVTRRHRTRLADAEELATLMSKHSVEVLGALINEY